MDVGGFGNIAIYFFSVLVVIAAVALVTFGIQTYTGRKVVDITADTMKDAAESSNVTPSTPAVAERSIFEGVKALMNPKGALQAAAKTKDANLLGQANAAAAALKKGI